MTKLTKFQIGQWVLALTAILTLQSAIAAMRQGADRV